VSVTVTVIARSVTVWVTVMARSVTVSVTVTVAAKLLVKVVRQVNKNHTNNRFNRRELFIVFDV
jgi:hypothetical protein